MKSLKFFFFNFLKLAGLWLVGEVVAIYGSKVAEGFSAFQRRSCYKCSYEKTTAHPKQLGVWCSDFYNIPQILFLWNLILLTNYWLQLHIFSCDQAALWMVQSVRLSVRLSVCPSVCPSVTPFWLCSHHHIIMKFSGVVTNDKSDVHAKGQGQRSKVKVTEVNSKLSCFRTVTPVWIQISWWNDAQSLMLLRRGALFFFKVIRQISRSHSSKNRRIWPRLGVSGL